MSRTLPRYALLVVLVALVYGRTLGHEFVSYDDATYVTKNPFLAGGLSARSVAWAFGTHGYAANWHPLTWLSHLLDVQLFGLTPAGHHATNLVLHALAACLCLAALRASGVADGPALFTAALFAVHPLRVESVAWVSERKDVLSGVFFFAALLAYARWTRAPGPGRYALVTLWIALGLSAKPMLVTLPFVLLVWDAWPLGRLPAVGAGRALREKAPWCLFAAGAALLTWRAQSGAGAVTGLDRLPLGERVANALVSAVAYLGDAVLPRGLACFRPHPALVDPGGAPGRALAAAGAGLLLVLVTLLALRLRRGRPWLLAGWLLYLGMLVPVIGLVQVGAQARADRYTYLPLLGPELALACEAGALVARGVLARRTALAAGVLAIVGYGAVAFRQAGFWRDSETLFRHALAVTDRNYVAHVDLAGVLARGDAADRREAIEHYEAALAIRPSHVEARNNLGAVLLAEGRPAEARRVLEEAVRLAPGYVEARFNLGLACRDLGDVEAARRSFAEALRLRPSLAAAREELERLDPGGGRRP